MAHTEPDHQLHARATLRLYLHAALQHRRHAILCLALPVSNVVLGVVLPFFASKVLADIVTRGPGLWTYFWIFVAAGAVGLLLNGIGIRNCMAIQAKVMDDLHVMVFDRLMQRSVGFYNNQIGGKLVSDALDFSGAFGLLCNAGFINAVGFAATTVVGLAVVIISNWTLGLCITVLLGSLMVWTAHESRKRSGLRNKRLRISKELTSHLSDSIVNAVTVKTFAQEAAELQRSRTISHRLAQARQHDWQRTVTSETERMGVLLLTQAVLIFVLITLTAKRPELLAAGIFAFTYTIGIISRFFTINTMVRQIEDSFLQASPITTLLEQTTEIQDASDATELVVSKGTIEYRNVSFHYTDAKDGQDVFSNIHLQVRPGEKIGLVGPSGGGKSTFTRLLLRFDDISSGSITIDDQDIRGVTQASLRRSISYVPQEPLLFHRSIYENIAYGNEGASKQAVETAARLAHAHEFIAALPTAYDTVVGERGVKLSGGQRQRIAIARALLKNAPLLILDEATSALDSESEKLIQDALWKLMADKTAIVIAHRLSTIQKLDRIVVLEAGNITEQGTHTALLAQNGTYAKLWAHQSGGFIEEN